MYQLKIIFKVFVASLLVFSFSNVFALSISEKIHAPETQIALGTYIREDLIEQPLLITSETNNNWSSEILGSVGVSFDEHGYFYKAACTGTDCVAIGAVERGLPTWPESYHKRTPIIFKSSNSGYWSPVDNIVGLPSVYDGMASMLSCADNTCAAIGIYNYGSEFVEYPLILTSEDRGKSWLFQQNVAHLPVLRSARVTGITHIDNSYIAVGMRENKSGNKMPFFLASQDNGKSWSYVENITGLPTMGFVNVETIKCNTTSCIAVGSYDDHKGEGIPCRGETHVLALLSQDKGQSWTFIKETPDLGERTSLFVKDLTYSNGYFIAVGEDVILISKNNGHSWSLIENINGSANSISCAEHFCIAGGNGMYVGSSGSNVNLLISHDDGQSWARIPNLPNVLPNNTINRVQCSGSRCTAVGNYKDKLGYFYPLILESNDSGESWKQPVIDGFPEHISNLQFSSLTNSKFM